MSQVKINNVTKSFGDTQVLEQINLQAENGEFLVLVGASGCGKSTLLRLIAGLDSPDEGSITINGKNMDSVPPSNRDVAMVFQNYALYPHLTVYNNMAFGLRQRKISEKDIDSKIQETARILKIDKLLDRRPKALSGGQRQRVALGRAMVRDPKVFLFDEPLSNLDAKLRQEMRLEIKKLHSLLKTTMIYVTHDQIEAMTMGDHIAIMRRGRIEQVDSPAQIYNAPKNRFVASFIGMPQMNFMKGEIVFKNDHTEFINSDMKFTINQTHPQKKKLVRDMPIIMGIRPENIHDNLFAEIKDGNNTVSASVELVENMGSHKVVHFKRGQCLFSAELKNFKEDSQNVDLIFDMNKTHFFNPDSKGIIS